MRKTVLLIEDEFYFRQALKKYISQYAGEFSLCGEARNGQDGLEKLLSLKPDIALVDITMPVLDGISVIRRAREQGAKTRMIILTGYGEFDYAKQAIQLGVQDYLLKPLQSDELYQSLKKAGQAIDREQETEKTMQIIAGARREIYSAYRDSLIQGLLLHGACPAEELRQNFGFPAEPRLYLAAVLDVYIKNENIWNPGDKKLCHYAICNVMGDIFRGSVDFGTCINEHGLICMVCHPLEEQGAESLLRESMQQVCSVAEEYLGLEVAVYFGGARARLEEVGESYQEALAMKKYQLFHERSGISFFHDSRVRPRLSKGCFSREERKELLSLMRANDTEAVHRLIRRVFARMEEGQLDSDSVYMHVTDLFSTVLDFATEYQMEFQNTSDQASLFSNILSAPSLQWLQKFVLDSADRIMAQINQRDPDAQGRLAQQVAEYIDANFSSPNLKLEVIAGEFYINIQYLCTVFKKHRNTTIGNYILEVRMSHARQELLNGAESITAVAYHCGYEDVGYFSKCFKRYYGVSPKKFMEQHAAGNRE